MKILDLERPMKLTNNGALEFIPIGVGGAFSDKMGHNNWLVRKGDYHVLIDMSAKTLDRLTDLTGVKYGGIENVIITHAHSDHCGGLELFAQYNRYVLKKKPMIIAPYQLQCVLWKLLKQGLANNESKKLEYLSYFDICQPQEEIEGSGTYECFLDKNLHLAMTKSIHSPSKSFKSYTLKFFQYNKSDPEYIYFTGDSVLNYEFLVNSESTKAIFHDVSFYPSPVHAYFDDYIKEVPKEIQEKTIFMHYNDVDVLPDCIPKFADNNKIYRFE